MQFIKEAIRLERGAWTRFLLGLGGLTVAFLAALYSTIFRQAGNFVATIVMASLALLLAGAVGLATVPYLARRVAFRRVRDAIDFEVSRAGLIYLGLVLVIAVAALNTGNNLLFMVVAALLAAVVISGLASLAVLRGLELEVVLPSHVFARTAVMARFTLTNPRRFWPSFSVSLVPQEVKRRRRLRARKTTFRFPWWKPAEQKWFQMRDIELRFEPEEPAEANQILSGSVYFPYVPPGCSASAAVQLNFARRGRYQQDTFALATRFPFAFLKKTRRIRLSREAIVYPPVDPLDASLEVLPMITGEFEAFVRGRGYDLYRIREYQPEDPRRHVDWKATAKTGELKVREFTREDERKLRIVFDNPAPGVLSTEQYENAVGVAASVAWHFAGEQVEISFAAQNLPVCHEVYDFLQYLALVQPVLGRSVVEELEVTGDYNVIITALPRGSIPTSIWTTSYIFFANGVEETKSTATS